MATERTRPVTPTSRRRLFDADVHHHFSATSDLAPYLHERATPSYYTGGTGVPNPRGAFRRDTVPPNGGIPASDPEYVAEDLLDRHDIDFCILNPGSTLGLGGMHDVDLAADLASATNDWTIHEWFPHDNRFLGSLLVGPRDPIKAAEEIRRVGSHPRMVQVTVNAVPWLLGSHHMHPIYEACQEMGLPFNMHVGGGGAGVNASNYPFGGATSFVESHLGMCLPALGHVVSFITEGIPVKYPDVKLILNEFGIAWLPFIMWRLDMEFRAGREDVPWLTELPSTYMRNSIRFTTQPLEEPKRSADLVALLQMVEARDMLVFSTDYPHWDADNPDVVLKAFDDDWRQRILWDNARELYPFEDVHPAPAAVATAEAAR